MGVGGSLSRGGHLSGSRSRFGVGPWQGTNHAAGATNSAVLGFTGAGTIQRVYIVRRPGHITGISTFLNTVNGTPAGTITISVFLNGSDAGSDYDLSITPATSADQGSYAIYSSPIAIAAGDLIDLRVTTTGDWNSTTADTVSFVEIED